MAELQGKKSDYNNQPVYYCPRCLSLRIMGVPGMEGLDYCDDCGSTQIEQSNIEDWQKKYRGRYGFDYLNNKI